MCVHVYTNNIKKKPKSDTLESILQPRTSVHLRCECIQRQKSTVRTVLYWEEEISV